MSASSSSSAGTEEPDAKRPRIEKEEGGEGEEIESGAELASGLAPSKEAEPFLEPELWSYWRSSSSYRVRIMLHLKGLEHYKYHAVHLLKDGGQQFNPQYVELNPSKEVPTIKIDGHVLTQSVAICEYLEETRPEPELLPRDDPYKRAVVRQLCSIISNDIQPVGNLRVLKHVQSFFADQKEKDKVRMEWAQKYIKLGMEAFEAVLAKHAGKFCVGDAITMADVFLMPQVYNAQRFKVDVAALYPITARIAAELEKHPAFIAAHPSKQPDAEPE
jgi:maleylacetoacetate isomerase